MKVFRDLEIIIKPDQIKDLIGKITDMLDANWTRNYQNEERVVKNLGRDVCFCFNRRNDKGVQATMLVLMRNNDDKIYVSNIVPTAVGHITDDQYNQILVEFYDKFIDPLENELDFKGILSSDNQTIEDWVSEKCAGLLRTFSAAANKGTGSHHPCDQERWFEFIIEAQKQKPKLEAHVLERWLFEEEKWTEEIASELAFEYENGISLLDFYVRNS
ncbi:MAG: hypothetical protein ABIE07_14280 [Candidatus Zixiibacteriota bacterium]